MPGEGMHHGHASGWLSNDSVKQVMGCCKTCTMPSFQQPHLMLPGTRCLHALFQASVLISWVPYR